MSYRLALNAPNGPTTCPADAGPAGSVGKGAPDRLWIVTGGRRCFAGIVGWSDTLPTAAAPITLGNFAGLYGTTNPDNGTRTVYAPVAAGENSVHPNGGWIGLTVAAGAPAKELVHAVRPDMLAIAARRTAINSRHPIERPVDYQAD